MDILAGIAAVKGALDITKALREIDGDINAAEYKMKIADLMSALADAKHALVDAQEKMQELEQKLKFRQSTVRIDGYLYETDEEGKATDVFYCPSCEHEDVSPIMILSEDKKFAKCPRCKFFRNMENEGYALPSRRRRTTRSSIKNDW